MANNISRRKFLSNTAAGAATLGAMTTGALAIGRDAPGSATGGGHAVTARDYLKKIVYKKDEVKQWLAEKAFPFAKYNAEWGWLLRNARFADGVDGSTSVYTYGPMDERITIHYKDQPCRINTYGNSYTQCH